MILINLTLKVSPSLYAKSWIREIGGIVKLNVRQYPSWCSFSCVQIFLYVRLTICLRTSPASAVATSTFSFSLLSNIAGFLYRSKWTCFLTNMYIFRTLSRMAFISIAFFFWVWSFSHINTFSIFLFPFLRTRTRSSYFTFLMRFIFFLVDSLVSKRMPLKIEKNQYHRALLDQSNTVRVTDIGFDDKFAQMFVNSVILVFPRKKKM